jgi:leucyl/phenylalanyl-tRNA--protein transferase
MNGLLSGGLYGLAMGKAFFGESMFHKEKDASKIALAALVERLKNKEFHFIDAQQNTQHLKSLGAVTVPRKKFLSMLSTAISYPTIREKW